MISVCPALILLFAKKFFGPSRTGEFRNRSVNVSEAGANRSSVTLPNEVASVEYSGSWLLK